MSFPTKRVAVGALASLSAAAVLMPAAAFASPVPAAPLAADELFISEYVEGSSNNKAIEIYNGTGGPVDLAALDYQLTMYFNGSGTAGLTIDLAGTVADGDVFVIANSSAGQAILAEANQTNGAGWFNGDDAVALTKGGTPIDVIGQIGVDPGSEWGTGDTSTQDNTLRRKTEITAGDPDGTDAFDPVLEWEGFAKDDVDGLGAHPGLADGGDSTDPEIGQCADEATPIGTVQGDGTATPMPGEEVVVEGVVISDFQSGQFAHDPSTYGLSGFHLQDSGDDDPATSDAIFVYHRDTDVSVGDRVRVLGTATEYEGLTQLADVTVVVCAQDAPAPAPTALELPVDAVEYEALESMQVTFTQRLSILEFYEYGRYGSVVLGFGDGTDRQHQPTAVHPDDAAEAAALAEFNLAHQIILDDASSNQNPDSVRHPDGRKFTAEHTFRGGDTLTGVTGILEDRHNEWRIQPTQGAEYSATNQRPDVPEVGGTLQVAAFNVLNYFTDFNGRGADDQAEFDRQEAKIVAALHELDADIVGLIEIENSADDTPLATLVEALNDKAGAGTYDYIATGTIGTDEITTAFIYQPSAVTPVGDFALLTSEADARFDDSENRPTLAQTFRQNSTGELVTVANNHLKSKGSECGEPGEGGLTGSCNESRTEAAKAMVDWLAADPTDQDAENILIVGDLNAYDKEDPIQVFTAAGYTDLLIEHNGEYDYSYVFDGQLGYLDHALANDAAAEQVTGAATWKINADEVSALDYDLTYKGDGQAALWTDDPYRSSDHDPVLIGLDLGGDDDDSGEGPGPGDVFDFVKRIIERVWQGLKDLFAGLFGR